MESQPVDSNDPIVRDGFRVVRKTFVVPENIHPLDSHTKRQATICNLFVNHQLPIADIVRVLDENYRHTVQVLIEQGIIVERRAARRTSDPPSRDAVKLKPRNPFTVKKAR